MDSQQCIKKILLRFVGYSRLIQANNKDMVGILYKDRYLTIVNGKTFEFYYQGYTGVLSRYLGDVLAFAWRVLTVPCPGFVLSSPRASY